MLISCRSDMHILTGHLWGGRLQLSAIEGLFSAGSGKAFRDTEGYHRQWRRPAHQRLREIFGEAKECPARKESSDEGGFDAKGSKGFGIQGFWGAEGTDEYFLTGILQVEKR